MADRRCERKTAAAAIYQPTKINVLIHFTDFNFDFCIFWLMHQITYLHWAIAGQYHNSCVQATSFVYLKNSFCRGRCWYCAIADAFNRLDICLPCAHAALANASATSYRNGNYARNGTANSSSPTLFYHLKSSFILAHFIHTRTDMEWEKHIQPILHMP